MQHIEGINYFHISCHFLPFLWLHKRWFAILQYHHLRKDANFLLSFMNHNIYSPSWVLTHLSLPLPIHLMYHREVHRSPPLPPAMNFTLTQFSFLVEIIIITPLPRAKQEPCHHHLRQPVSSLAFEAAINHWLAAWLYSTLPVHAPFPHTLHPSSCRDRMSVCLYSLAFDLVPLTAHRVNKHCNRFLPFLSRAAHCYCVTHSVSLLHSSADACHPGRTEPTRHIMMSHASRTHSGDIQSVGIEKQCNLCKFQNRHRRIHLAT